MLKFMDAYMKNLDYLFFLTKISSESTINLLWFNILP